MKKLFIFITVTLYAFTVSALEISVESGSFKSDNKTYLETYIRVLGNSTEFIQIQGGNGLLQAGVELTFIIKDKDQIVSFEKYVLNSPQMKVASDFLDVKRFALAPGQYNIEILAIDINKAENNLEIKKRVTINEYNDKVDFSDIQLFGKVEKANADNPLAKNGLYMEPLNYGLLTEDIDVLNIYTEVYKALPISGPNFIKYTILEGFEDGGSEVMKKVKKLSGVEFEPLLLQLPVDKLVSGNYRLELEVFNKAKVVLKSKSIDFVRSNPAFDLEYWKNYNSEEENSFVTNMTAVEVKYGLKATSPIVYEPKRSLLDYMIKDAPLKAQKKFLFSIWNDKEPQNTEFHYREYLKFAKAIDLEYNSNVGYGFETDRGYIFLRYGKPNNVHAVDHEVDAYPYEIWYYNYLEDTNQTNVRFIFYNRSLVHNDYELLHSTCRVEKQNPAWEINLYQRGLEVRQSSAIDGGEVQEGWNRQAKKFFNEY